jgi:hypothetical protein
MWTGRRRRPPNLDPNYAQIATEAYLQPERIRPGGLRRRPFNLLFDWLQADHDECCYFPTHSIRLYFIEGYDVFG